MSLIVQKFGGSSVKDAERIFNVAGIIGETYDNGNDVVVIVSAQGKTTDELIAKAHEINENPSKREMDMLLTTGEQISIALLAMALEKLGYPVVSYTGWQIGLKTDSNHGNAKIRRIWAEPIRKAIDKRKIVIVAGFQGTNRYDDVTTLGRGGSDTTAVAIAAVIKADLCQIYTDVEGVYTADPRKVPGALKLAEITFDEMLELASLGAQVLHSRSVELAKKYNVNLEVLSSLTKASGTKVKEVVAVEKKIVRGVAKDDNIGRIAVMNVVDEPGRAFKIFSMLSSKGYEIDMIVQSISRPGTNDISFTIKKTDFKNVIALLTENKETLGFEELKADDDLSKVSIVGAGMVGNTGVAASMFEALYDKGINIEMISTSEISVSVVVKSSMADIAVEAIHDKFIS